MVNKTEKLKEIVMSIADCQKCPLYKRATLSVPGEGNPEATIMFIGEGPGYNEDRLGRPFVGQAGKLLDSLLLSIGIKRKEVFICNVVKHRPPENRDPSPEEIEACRNFLDSQIEAIDPKIIVTLGRFSLNKFLPGEYISQVHGQARFVNFGGKELIVIPMYHPAAALRNGKIMAELRSDFKSILKFIRKEPEKEEESQKQLSLIN